MTWLAVTPARQNSRRPHSGPGDSSHGASPTTFCATSFAAAKYPGRHPADVRAAAHGCGARTDGRPCSTRRRCSTRRASPSSVPPWRLPPAKRSTTLRTSRCATSSRAPASSTAGRLRGLPRRFLAQRPGHPRQLQVPQPAANAVQGRRPGTLINKFLDPDIDLARHRHRQPRDGHRCSRSWCASSTRTTTRGGRALDAARRRAPDGQPGVPAGRGPDQVRHLPAL